MLSPETEALIKLIEVGQLPEDFAVEKFSLKAIGLACAATTPIEKLSPEQQDIWKMLQEERAKGMAPSSDDLKGTSEEFFPTPPKPAPNDKKQR